MTPDEIEIQLQMTIVGGSTQKPTGESKKQQACRWVKYSASLSMLHRACVDCHVEYLPWRV